MDLPGGGLAPPAFHESADWFSRRAIPPPPVAAIRIMQPSGDESRRPLAFQ
jgi:hypothetical protein